MRSTILSLLTLVTLGQAQNSCSTGVFTDTTYCNTTRVSNAAQVGPGTTCVNKSNLRVSCARTYSGYSPACTWTLWENENCQGNYYARHGCNEVGNFLFVAGSGKSLSVTCT
ncbi:hypothetical protein F5Y18DRAFT_396571 [Xylariaceae sp. FL1019]|nr:hypothetical protein F5Y18DRAFT_396571 [Xylariaceae sp. FL1019]